MSKSSQSQFKREAKKSALPAPVAVSVLDYLLPILGGAIVTMFVLSLFKFGAAEVWSPFARSGPNILKNLAVSALAGGVAAAILGRRFSGPLAATACALGWAMWGLSLHWGAQGQYLQILGGGLQPEMAGGVLFTNAVAQSLSVAFALLLASGISWLWARRRTDLISDEAPVTDDDLDGNGIKSFSTAFVYPLATLIGGVILLNLCGFLVLPLGARTLQQLPSGPGVAALCGVLTMVSLFVATFVSRRAFRALGSIGDVVIAPLAIAVVAAFANSMRPAALLIWHTSAFELASWGALGASLGYYAARASVKVK